jgi:tetratricopeptide (TPR) repeat protein
LHHGASGRLHNPAHVLAAADDVRQAIEDILDDGSGPQSRLDRLEADTDQHARDALTVPPLEMVCRLGLGLVDARHLARTRPSDDERRRVKRIAARLAALTADEMMVLGNVYGARAWYSTATAAADATGIAELRADVRALSAMLPLYHGNPEDAAALAAEAGVLASRRNCLATGLAPMLEGLAWAKAGRSELAQQALDTARKAYEGIGPERRAENVFGFSPRRRLFYEGRLLTMLGDYEAAWTAHRQAAEMYPTDVVGDRALISLDRALSLVSTDEAEAGATLVVDTLNRLPATHRTRIFLDAARGVVGTIPPAQRALPAVRESLDVLAELGEDGRPAGADPRSRSLDR